MLIAERFLSGCEPDHGNHPVSTDGGTWYPMACRFLTIRASYSFLSGEKPDRKEDAVYQR